MTIPCASCALFDLRKEINELGASNAPERKKVIHDLRECKKFTPWHQGFTPKEHQEMLDRQWMLKHQAKVDRRDRKWREDQAKKSNRGARLSLSVAIIGIIVAALINLYTAHLKNSESGRTATQASPPTSALPKPESPHAAD